MDWQEKLQALNALSQCTLIMRKPGDWYVRQSTEKKIKGMLCGEYGNGASPERVVDDHWKKIAEGSNYDTPIVTKAMSDDRKEHYWNGFMWVDVTPKNKPA